MSKILAHFFLLATASVALAGGDIDPKDWTPVRIPGKQKAPEFADIDAWLNGDAQQMARLKGKVVVVHFMAFGWINCVRNYPWYKGIWKEFKDKGVVMIGIHTPETEAEKDVKRVQKKLADAGLTFPIAIDNRKTMWMQYHNGYWPSVYLIDKEGIARWGWQGELGWKGAKGEEHMRKKIEELLKE